MTEFESLPLDDCAADSAIKHRDFFQHILAVHDQDVSDGAPFRFTKMPDYIQELHDSGELGPILERLAGGVSWMVTEGQDGSSSWLGPLGAYKPDAWRKHWRVGY
ncbi:hypothetical protein SEA_MOLLYMUR_73 [Gordonia phage Mollymur]|uniref:Uncharacterized protein n=1 Tax=Gordonia phage Mollymur TaxID=2590895 RepID=A0A4Y6E9T6_9CAUD|nr:hypothetical protein PQB84_gp053 [Gordonia phage Mollymur]QDF15433.1 hypothetical protein SEA_MOLLYMUR_73 [Gordonia phage Mollymur]